MDELELKTAGLDFRVGEDLYGVSIAQLLERLDILRAEQDRVRRALAKKSAEISSAETFFKKP